MQFPTSTWVFVVVCALGLGSCTEIVPVEYAAERRLVLETVADILVIPGYEVLEQQTDSLATAIEALVVQPDQAHLELARSAWKNALLVWERVVPYDFGPAESTFGSLNADIATFPVNVQKIEVAIAAGDTSTQDFNRDKRGFFALEYLLYSDEGQPILNSDSIMRRVYLGAAVRHLHRNVQTVRARWIGYRSDFIQRSGTDAGSSLSLLFNAMNMSYEQAKNFKVTVPAGRRVGQTMPVPEAVEAFYSGNSIRALKIHIRSVFEIWSGNEPSLHGFQYYLRILPNGERLIDDTKRQMDSVDATLNAISDNERLSDLIAANDPRVEALLEHMQKMTRFFKSELSSLIGISITYSSGDGD